MKLLKSIPLALLGLVCAKNYAQEFKADLQIRPRFEYTNGFGTLLTPTTEHTSFIGNRTRLNLNYGDDKLKMKVAMQNVRTWGAVNHLQGGLSGQANDFVMFEGWAEYSFTKTFSTKIGRQPLSYDNQRILGGLDWANQGRSFDAALLKYKGAKSQLDLGFALNSSLENDKTISNYNLSMFTSPLNFKDMQYAWFHTNIEKVGVSLLALNVGIQYDKDLDPAKVDVETNYLQTLGTFVDYKGKKLAVDFSLYGQTGKMGASVVSAWNTAANIGYAFSPKFKATAGFEFLSGKDDNATTMTKHFTPLYGTNHAFNGYMDYFYVATPHGNVGLKDYSLKFEFPIKKVNVSIMPHAFQAVSAIKQDLDNRNEYLGTELDVTAAYKVSKDIMVIGGYSQMFATETMVAIKGGAGLNGTTNNWAWVMININPQIFSSK